MCSVLDARSVYDRAYIIRELLVQDGMLSKLEAEKRMAEAALQAESLMLLAHEEFGTPSPSGR